MNRDFKKGADNRRKTDDTKRSISAPTDLFRQADERMAQQTIENFSEYVRGLIRRDLEEKTLVSKSV